MLERFSYVYEKFTVSESPDSAEETTEAKETTEAEETTEAKETEKTEETTEAKETEKTEEVEEVEEDVFESSVKIYIIVALVSIAILFFIIIMAFSPYSYYSSHYGSHYSSRYY